MSADQTRYNSHMMITASQPLKTRKRRSPYTRLNVPSDMVPPRIRITDRVTNLLSVLAAYRHLSTDQLTRFDAGDSPAYTRHLMRLMHRHGLVERPAGQAVYLSSFVHEGNPALVYCITRKGMKVLAENGKPVDSRLDWTLKNTGTSAVHLAHTLGVSEFMLSLWLALPRDKSLTLLDHHSLLPTFPTATQAHKYPFELSVHANIDKLPMTLTVRPDRLFCLGQIDQHHLGVALEVDRGTESLSTRSKKITTKATWRKKVAGYYHAFRAGKFKERWGFEAFRIATVTTSDVRIDNMLTLQREVTHDQAHGLFLYTTRARLSEYGVLGSAWRSANADSLPLVGT